MREKDERAMDIHTARVLLREASARRHAPAFHARLLQWAANARRRASIPQLVEQPDLFARKETA